MKKYVSVNAKYYTKKELDRIERHNSREAKIDYLIENKKHKNFNYHFFGASTISGAYDVAFERANQKMLKSKNTAYNAKNQLIEAVVALSEDQVVEILKNPDGADKINKTFIALANSIEREFGFAPLEVSVHYDEGHKSGKTTKRNYHAHITFLNFDFEECVAPLRSMKKRNWAEMQDLAAHEFSNLGFVRGELDSKAVHQERAQYIKSAKKKGEIEENILQDAKKIISKNTKFLTFDKVQAEKDIAKTLRKYAKTDFLSKSDADIAKVQEKLNSAVYDNNDLHAKLQESESLEQRNKKLTETVEKAKQYKQYADKKIDELSQKLKKTDAQLKETQTYLNQMQKEMQDLKNEIDINSKSL